MQGVNGLLGTSDTKERGAVDLKQFVMESTERGLDAEDRTWWDKCQKGRISTKMRSAQIHFCTWAIMKKLSICLLKLLFCRSFDLNIIYLIIMNKL